MNLAQKRVLITRPREHAIEFIEALKSAGAEPILFPVFEISPLQDFTEFDFALRALPQFDWLIFSSAHSAHAFFKRLRELEIESLPDALRIAVIGSKTASCLESYGRMPNFIPSKYMATEILSGLQPVRGKRFLLLQSNLSAHTLAEALREDGGEVLEVTAYRNEPHIPDLSAFDNLRNGVDVITFTSPSSVQNFKSIVEKYSFHPKPLIACIGPVTAQAARDTGFTVDVEAQEHTIAGLFEALKEL